VDYLYNLVPAEVETTARKMAESGKYDLLMDDSGAVDPKTIAKICTDYPKMKFAYAYQLAAPAKEYEAPNLKLVSAAGVFNSEYLAGIVAGYMTKAKIVGSINADRGGGSAAGYWLFKIGVEEVDPAIKTLYAITGSWDDPIKGKAAADSLIVEGCDLVHGMGDGLTDGVISSAKDHDVWTIGSLLDLHDRAPEHVLTSTLYDETPVYADILEQLVTDTWKGYEFYFYPWNHPNAPEMYKLAPFYELENVIPQECKDHLTRRSDDLLAGKFDPYTKFPPTLEFP